MIDEIVIYVFISVISITLIDGGLWIKATDSLKCSLASFVIVQVAMDMAVVSQPFQAASKLIDGVQYDIIAVTPKANTFHTSQHHCFVSKEVHKALEQTASGLHPNPL